MTEKSKKKILLSESIVFILISIIADSYELGLSFLSAIPVLGIALMVINWFLDIIVWITIQAWLLIRGESSTYKLTNGLFAFISSLELITFLDALPMRTATLFVCIYLINHPKIKKIAELSQANVNIKTTDKGYKIKSPVNKQLS